MSRVQTLRSTTPDVEAKEHTVCATESITIYKDSTPASVVPEQRRGQPAAPHVGQLQRAGPQLCAQGRLRGPQARGAARQAHARALCPHPRPTAPSLYSLTCKGPFHIGPTHWANAFHQRGEG
ncbi:unnamed protein product, partial [Iphiclides podalirius]